MKVTWCQVARRRLHRQLLVEPAADALAVARRVRDAAEAHAARYAALLGAGAVRISWP